MKRLQTKKTLRTPKRNICFDTIKSEKNSQCVICKIYKENSMEFQAIYLYSLHMVCILSNPNIRK